ncbi:MAG: site-specific integrase, partial [Planctomycetes bacterium]|nr:site-specific integrase [Planctomycetota bacterium]
MSAQKSLITEFIHYLQYERYFSPHTAKCYTADLQQFCGYLCQHDDALSAVASKPPSRNGQSHSALPVVDFESPLLSEK